jgi:hypothetical protein
LLVVTLSIDNGKIINTVNTVLIMFNVFIIVLIMTSYQH